MHHSHDETHRLIPKVGDSMVTNLRRPIFTLLEDTGPGVHDTTVSACDQYLYQQQIGVVSACGLPTEAVKACDLQVLLTTLGGSANSWSQMSMNGGIYYNTGRCMME